jgi:hypothetical protein
VEIIFVLLIFVLLTGIQVRIILGIAVHSEIANSQEFPNIFFLNKESPDLMCSLCNSGPDILEWSDVIGNNLVFSWEILTIVFLILTTE